MENNSSILGILDKKSIFDFLDSRDITTGKAIDIISGLSNEQILEVDEGGLNVLHRLAFDNTLPKNLDIEKIVKALVAKNPEILNEKRNGYTPIEFAILQENLEYLKILMPYFKGREEKIKILDWPKGSYVSSNKLDAKENIEGDVISGEREFLSPLSFALRHGQFEMFEYLCKNGFGPVKGLEDLSKYNLDEPTEENLQELYKDLFVVGNKELLKSLHRHLGYYEGYEGQNSPELIAAVVAGNKDQALKLIAQGHYFYDFTAFTEYDFDELLVRRFVFLETLKHPNYNILAQNNNGYTPMHDAAWGGHKEVVVALLEVAKGDPELLKTLFAPDIDGNTPLHLAAAQGYEEVAVALLGAAKGNSELLQILFAPSKRAGLTPLRWAARDGCTKVVEVLLACGACPSLSMLLNNTFSSEMNSLLRSAFVKSICHAVSNTLECASQVLYGNMIELYDEEHTRAEQNRQRNNNDDTRSR